VNDIANAAEAVPHFVQRRALHVVIASIGVSGDPYFDGERDPLVSLAARYRPTGCRDQPYIIQPFPALHFRPLDWTGAP
jgi:hypothetical protein